MIKRAFRTILAMVAAVAVFAAPAPGAKDCGDAVMLTISGKAAALQALEILPPPGFAYSIIDGSLSPQQFTWIAATLKSRINFEALNAGVVTAYAVYRKRDGYMPDLTNEPPYPWDRQPTVFRSESAPLAIDGVEAGGQVEVVFDFAADPIPAGITDLYLEVVYKGSFGSRQLPITAQGFKDINEPHHWVFFNHSDYVYCIGPPAELVTYDEFHDTPCPGCEEDDPMFDAPWDDLLVEVAMAADQTPQTDWIARRSAMPAGSYFRLIFLAEGASFFIHIKLYSEAAVYGKYSTYSVNGLVNQMCEDGYWYNRNAVYARGIACHDGSVWVVQCGPSSAPIYQGLWPSLAGQAPVAMTYVFDGGQGE